MAGLHFPGVVMVVEVVGSGGSAGGKGWGLKARSGC